MYVTGTMPLDRDYMFVFKYAVIWTMSVIHIGTCIVKSW